MITINSLPLQLGNTPDPQNTTPDNQTPSTSTCVNIDESEVDSTMELGKGKGTI